MKVCGIVAEFNPFHNGHAYLLKAAAQQNDAVICVMSGNFVQRGDLALFEKSIRVEAALLNGADLVLELPVGYALSGAQNFAKGAMALLQGTGVVNTIAFGVEQNNTAALNRAAEWVRNPAIIEKTVARCRLGEAFAVARTAVLREADLEAASLLSQPNSILAVEYLNACHSLSFHPEILPVLRCGAQHHDSVASGRFACAGALRKQIESEPVSAIFSYIPENLQRLYQGAVAYQMKELETALLFSLRGKKLSDFEQLPDLCAGLDRALFEAVRRETQFGALVASVTGKRFPAARIRRLLLCCALGISNEYHQKTPPYLRVLGFRKEKEELIRKIADKAALPLLFRSSDPALKDSFCRQTFETEAGTTDFYALAGQPVLLCGTEYRRMPVKV